MIFIHKATNSQIQLDNKDILLLILYMENLELIKVNT